MKRLVFGFRTTERRYGIAETADLMLGGTRIDVVLFEERHARYVAYVEPDRDALQPPDAGAVAAPDHRGRVVVTVCRRHERSVTHPLDGNPVLQRYLRLRPTNGLAVIHRKASVVLHQIVRDGRDLSFWRQPGREDGDVYRIAWRIVDDGRSTLTCQQQQTKQYHQEPSHVQAPSLSLHPTRRRSGRRAVKRLVDPCPFAGFTSRNASPDDDPVERRHGRHDPGVDA